MEAVQEKTLAKLFAEKFISRPDIMALQVKDGGYRPVKSGFDMAALLAHIRCEKTYGHYIMKQDNTVKFFALSVNLEETGKLPTEYDGEEEYCTWEDCNPRELWMSRKQGPPRNMIKLQLRMIANKLARIIHDEEFGIPVVAYSGSRGIHVYSLTGSVEAADAREAMRIILKATGWTLSHGKNSFKHEQDGDVEDQFLDFHQYSLDTFPAKDTLSHGGFGDLLRLPLGVDLRSPKDRGFFLDMRGPLSEFKPMDPIEALTTTSIWKYPDEK